MNDMEQYYYEKGKTEGFLEGVASGHEMILGYVQKESAPPIVIQCNGEPHIRKFFEEMKS